MRFSRTLIIASLALGAFASGPSLAASFHTVYKFTGIIGNDGAVPENGLISNNGALFGTTVIGGVHDAGLIFKLDLKTGAETKLYSFAGSPDG